MFSLFFFCDCGLCSPDFWVANLCQYIYIYRNGKFITNDDNEDIPDTVNTLIFTIAQHFIGDQVVKDIKLKVQSIKCLYLPVPQAFKIVKTNASDIGYGGILKQRVNTQENVITYTSKH